MKGTAMITQHLKVENDHLKIVVDEGRVTLEDLHKALDIAVKQMVPKGGCNCGLTGFDISFLRGNPALSRALSEVTNIQGGILERGNIANTVGH
jgi:hypothetical protein